MSYDLFMRWGLVVGLLGFTMFRWGGTLPPERLVLHVGAGLLFLMTVLLRPWGRLPETRLPLRAWTGLVGFFGLVLFTLAPLPAGVLRVVAPETARVWDRARPEDFSRLLDDIPQGGAVRALLPLMGSDRPCRPISIWPEGTWHDLMDWTACGAVAFAVAYGWRRRTLIGWTFGAVIVLAVFQALYGLFGYWTGHLPWPAAERATVDRASGSFYNANHYVDFLGLSLPVAIAVWLGWWGELRRRLPRNFWGRVRVVLNTAGGLFPVLTLGILAILLGIGFSRSRGGISATLLVLAGMLLGGSLRRSNRREAVAPGSRPGGRRRWVRPLVVLLLLGLVLFLWVGPRPILERLALIPQELELEPGRRLSAWRDTLRLIGRFPVWGTGLGTFGEAFYTVQSFYSGGRWNAAHNELLQWVSDTGLLGLAALGVWLGALVRWFRRTPLESGTLGLWSWGCRMGLTYFGLDSLVDLNLRIPTNVLLAMVLLGLMVAMRHVDMSRGLATRRFESSALWPEEGEGGASRPAPLRRGEGGGVLSPDISPPERGWAWLRAVLAGGVGVVLAGAFIVQSVRLYAVERVEEDLYRAVRQGTAASAAALGQARALLAAGRGTSRLYQYLGILETPTDPSVENTAPAVAAYVMAAVANPQDYVSRRNLADLLWRTGAPSRWPERFWRDALAIIPSEAPLWYELGLFYWVWGRIDEALEAFQTAVRWDPGLARRVYGHLIRLGRPELLERVTPPDLRPELAEFLVGRGFPEAARSVLQAVLDEGHGDVIRRALPLAATHPEMGLLEAFLERLRDRRDRDPDLIYWDLVGRIRAGRWEDLEAVIQEALRVADRTYGRSDRAGLDYRGRLAQLLAGAGLRGTAQTIYMEALAQDSAYGPAYQGLGRLALQDGRLEEAFRWLRQAPEDDATRTALFQVGMRAFEAGQVSLAEQVFEFMRDRWAYRVDGYRGLAALYERGGRWAEALEAARRAWEARPDDTTLALQVARLEYRVGDRLRAVQAWEQVLERDPRSAEAYGGLVEYYRSQGLATVADDLCRRARAHGVQVQACGA
ncbi:Lipopolysaccharide assembly protein B [bacterium HR11]|nr:Lipopolysaccharide assembly protein B [bacterium HR11]